MYSESSYRPAAHIKQSKDTVASQTRERHPKRTATPPKNARMLSRFFRLDANYREECDILLLSALLECRILASNWHFARTLDDFETIWAVRRDEVVAFFLISGIYSDNPGTHDPQSLESTASNPQVRSRANNVARWCCTNSRPALEPAPDPHSSPRQTRTRARARRAIIRIQVVHSSA